MMLACECDECVGFFVGLADFVAGRFVSSDWLFGE